MPRFLRRTLRVLLAIFLLLNVIAALHAWRFTHFEDDAVARTQEKGLSFGEKLGILFTGARNPRPRNNTVPDTAYVVVRIPSNVMLEAWWMPRDSACGTVILFHGYGGSKSGLTDKAGVFRALGYNTLLVDFMGAGGSEGRQCTVGYKEAVEVRDALNWVRARGEQNTVLYGTSMGAAAILKALSDSALPVRSAIVECPFGTMLETVKNRFHSLGVPTVPMAHLLLFWGGVLNGFNAFAHNPETYAARVHCPVLLMWGELDAKVLRSETYAIYHKLAGPKKLVTFPLAGHENYLVKYRQEWTAAVTGFLE